MWPFSLFVSKPKHEVKKMDLTAALKLAMTVMSGLPTAVGDVEALVAKIKSDATVGAKIKDGLEGAGKMLAMVAALIE